MLAPNQAWWRGQEEPCYVAKVAPNFSTEINLSPPIKMAEQPVRLAYDLLLGQTTLARLIPRLNPKGAAFSEAQAKALLPKLHDLDRVIITELRSATVFGEVSDTTLARLLPLLAQRTTRLNDVTLQIAEVSLTPRIKVIWDQKSGGQLLCGLSTFDGDWLDLSAGRLIAGSQAFFITDGRVFPIESKAPAELSGWTRKSSISLGLRFGAKERDSLVKNLTKLGVPSEDLQTLVVRRGPPQKVCVKILPPLDTDLEPTARATLEMDYGSIRLLVDGQRSSEPYVTAGPNSPLVLIERDLNSEDEACESLEQRGFRAEQNGIFVARQEAAIEALDPKANLFPEDWLIERATVGPTFYRDLTLKTQVRLTDNTGLLDVKVDFGALNEDEQIANNLIELRELLIWLQSGRKYLRLNDGSYVAPSAGFRRDLKIIEDLGAETERVLVSPLCVGLLQTLGDSTGLAAADAATSAWLNEVAGNEGPQIIEPPNSLSGVLREYQRRGLDWLAMLHRYRLTGILADDMGLGKTVQTLALLALLREQEGPKPSVVVAPTSVVSVWRDESARFTPDLNVVLWQGAPKQRRELDVKNCDLIVVSYGLLRRDADILGTLPMRYAILDEAQSAKNASTQNARAVRKLKSERRLALTGTPIENRPEELWAAFDFLAPGFLGSLRLFRRRYARLISAGDEQALSLLRARIGPLILRRLKSEVAKELPPKIETTVRCEMLPAQRALYDHVAGKLRESVKQKIEKVGLERAQLDVLAALTRLRQICADPALLPAPAGTKFPGSAKLDLFEELMREALASERRVIVFSQFVQMQKRLIERIRSLGVSPLWLHGGTKHRDQVVSAFQTPSGPPVIVISLKAGGTGLTLTRADTVIHYDPWWNPAVERQATDRAHRLGQTQKVTVYRLVCSQSIEERVVELAEHKDALASSLLGSDGQAGFKHLTVQDVLTLLA